MVSDEQRDRAQSGLTDFVGVVTERQTYRNLLYLFVTSFVGGLYFIGIFFGFFAALVLTFVLVGIPIFLVLLAGTRGAAELERQLTNRLLGTNIQSPTSGVNPLTYGWGAALRELVTADTTWKGIGFLAIKGVIAFLLPLFVLLAGVTSLALVLSPVGEPVLWEVWTIDTWIESLIAVPLGILIGLATLHALNGLARVIGSIAESLL
ncbi:sensor domain-containing protein [Natronorubrum texcoconense]|uniref:Putative sensor n=1 Tax=Natronorubrum texcoconense TaxID=1095776 RepID=A0A1G9DCY6_9EURY|nr:sensor domain-containing protein [Natronorubrum texcoconense]SDK61720.1 Putative sensor [Natronorubrum texcoconense]